MEQVDGGALRHTVRVDGRTVAAFAAVPDAWRYFAAISTDGTDAVVEIRLWGKLTKRVEGRLRPVGTRHLQVVRH